MSFTQRNRLFYDLASDASFLTFQFGCWTLVLVFSLAALPCGPVTTVTMTDDDDDDDDEDDE